jgi:molybdate transport system substrate-binding protein
MQFAMAEITEEFQKTTGNPCELITSSSGKLTAQISNGAPFDIFLSADARYPNRLFEKGLTSGEPRTYAYGQLVLWTYSDTEFDDFSALNDRFVQYIAMANPATAPYGRATKEALEKLNLWDSVQSKLVFGESISQSTQFIETGTANLGFTSMSVVKAPRFVEKGHWIPVPDTLYSRIEQQLVILASAEPKKTIAEDFVTFLNSQKAREILVKYGYRLP